MKIIGFSFSGTKKYKSKKTINKILNCCGLEFLKFVNIDYYYFPKITLFFFVLEQFRPFLRKVEIEEDPPMLREFALLSFREISSFL